MVQMQLLYNLEFVFTNHLLLNLCDDDLLGHVHGYLSCACDSVNSSLLCVIHEFNHMSCALWVEPIPPLLDVEAAPLGTEYGDGF